MVRRGEFLERAVVIPGVSPLDGLYHRGSVGPAVLLVPPHPFEAEGGGAGGGAMESAILSEMAWALTRAGHATLRFNFRGIGASPGSFDPDRAHEDVLAACDHLAVTSGSNTAVVAVAWGVVPVIRALRLQGLRCPAGSNPAVVLVIDPRMSTLREALEPETLGHAPGGLRVGRVPGQIVIPEDYEPTERKALLAWVEGNSGWAITRVAGANRSFSRGLSELGKVVAAAVSGVCGEA